MSSKSIVLVVLPIEFCHESRRFHLEFCRESRCFCVKFSTLKIPVVSKLRLFTGLQHSIHELVVESMIHLVRHVGHKWSF